jgi:hypothetical protein
MIKVFNYKPILDVLPVMCKTDNHARNLMVFCSAVMLMSFVQESLSYLNNECILNMIVDSLRKLNDLHDDLEIYNFVGSYDSNDNAWAFYRKHLNYDFIIALDRDVGIIIELNPDENLMFSTVIRSYLSGSYCTDRRFRDSFAEKSEAILKSLINFIQRKSNTVLRAFGLCKSTDDDYNDDNDCEYSKNGIVEECLSEEYNFFALDAIALHVLKNFFEPEQQLDTMLPRDITQTDDHNSKDEDIIVSDTAHETKDTHETKEKKKPYHFICIIPLILFLLITSLSNIFAWANIIAIAAMMTKIIISGVGSVIGLGLLVGAIALGCKDKVCGERCRSKSKDSFTLDDKVEEGSTIQKQQTLVS